VAADPAAQAKRIFKTKCVVCHGETGKGDGPGAASLTPKPRNYSDAEWQKSVTDEQLKKTILLGGAGVGKSAGMPANSELRGKDAVLDELVKLIRSFAAK
jgi:mono/diheme cytochrome c family protein